MLWSEKKKKRYVKQLIYSCSWQFITFNGTLPYVWLNFMRCSDNIQTLYRLKPLLIMHSCAVMSRLRNRAHVSHKNIHILLTKEHLGTYMQTLECTYLSACLIYLTFLYAWTFYIPVHKRFKHACTVILLTPLLFLFSEVHFKKFLYDQWSIRIHLIVHRWWVRFQRCHSHPWPWVQASKACHTFPVSHSD